MKAKNKSPTNVKLINQNHVASTMETRSIRRHRHRRMHQKKRNQQMSKIKNFQNN